MRLLTGLALAQLAGGGCALAAADVAGSRPAVARGGAAPRSPAAARRRIELLNAGRHPAQRASLRGAARAPGQPAPAAPGGRPRRRLAAAGGGELVERCLARLPFRLTGAQRRAWTRSPRPRPRAPMMRLVQGRGSAKTVVAALARCVRWSTAGSRGDGSTELLAEQHARNFASWLDRSGCAWAPHRRLAAAAARRSRATSRPARCRSPWHAALFQEASSSTASRS